MMSANLNAAGIIGVIVCSLVFLLKFGKRPKSIKPVLAGLFCGLILAAVSVMISFHSCLNGQPFLQWLIPSISMGLLITFLRDKWKLVFLACIMTLASLLLSLHFSTLVHTDHYIGVPDPGIPNDDGDHIREIDTFRLWHTSFSGIYGIKQAEK